MPGRKVTCQLLAMMDAGELDAKRVAEACLNFMSEDDVAEMAHNEELIIDESQDNEENE